MLVKLEELYKQVTDNGHTVTMDDLIAIARLRKEFVSRWSPRTNFDVALIRQKLREAKGGMRCSPSYFVHMKIEGATSKELGALAQEIKNVFNCTIKHPTAMSLILPVNKVEEAIHSLDAMYHFYLVKENKHLIEQFSPPNN